MSYPNPFEVLVQNKMSLLRGLGQLSRSITLEGTWWSVVVLSEDGSRVIYESAARRKTDVADVKISLPFLTGNRYRIRLNLTNYNLGGNTRTTVGVQYLILLGGWLLVTSKSINRAMNNSLPMQRKRTIFFRVSSQAKGASRPNPETYVTLKPHISYDIGIGIRKNESFQITTFYREWSGVRTPDYKLKRRLGTLPVNPHHVYLYKVVDMGVYERVSIPPGRLTEEVWPYTYVLGSTATGVDHLQASHNTEARNKALKRIQDKAGANVSNIALDVLQFNQLDRMVGNTANRIAGSLKALKKGNLPGAVKSLWGGKQPRFRRRSKFGRAGNSLASNWLELQYGWKPLLMDAEGAAQGLARFHSADRVLYTLRSSAVIKEPSHVALLTGGNLPVQCGNQFNIKISTSRFGIRYWIGNELQAFLQQTGFSNPVNLAWELVPFSFVVDWFLPIGSFLESLTAWQGLSFDSGYETAFTKEYNFCDISYRSNHIPGQVPGVGEYDLLGAYATEAVRSDRTVLTDFPTQTFPQIKNPLTFTHSLNALALLRSVFK